MNLLARLKEFRLSLAFALNCRNLSALAISLPAHTHTRTHRRPVTLKTPAIATLASSRSHSAECRFAGIWRHFVGLPALGAWWKRGNSLLAGFSFFQFCPIGLCGRCSGWIAAPPVVRNESRIAIAAADKPGGRACWLLLLLIRRRLF